MKADNNVTFTFKHNCTNNNYVKQFTAPVIKDGKIYNLIITELGAVMLQVDPSKPTEGTGEFSLSLTLALSDTNYVGHLAMCRLPEKTKFTTSLTDKICDPTKPQDFYFYEVNYDDEKDTDLDSVIPLTTNSGPDKIHSASGYTFKAIRPGM